MAGEGVNYREVIIACLIHSMITLYFLVWSVSGYLLGINEYFPLFSDQLNLTTVSQKPIQTFSNKSIKTVRHLLIYYFDFFRAHCYFEIYFLPTAIEALIVIG